MKFFSRTSVDGAFHTIDSIRTKLNQFNIQNVAILWDGETEIRKLFEIDGINVIDIYSFDLNLIGTTFGKYAIKAVVSEENTRVDGWVVSSKMEFDSFSLNQYLYDNSREGETIAQHYKHPGGTVYYSYVDFFSGSQTTVVQINNYYRRCYNIPFPLDLRLTLRDCQGNVISARQIIIPADAIRIIRSEDFTPKELVGYLEVEYEISRKTMPFLHYMADYLSQDFISSNHQSGLGLHPPGASFSRGYIPVEEDETMTVCLFQRNYSEPITVKAVLHFTQNGVNHTIEKALPPIQKQQMLFQDIKELFNSVDFSQTQAPYVDIQSNVPIFRPNYYYSKRGKSGYYDVSHAARVPDQQNEPGYTGIKPFSEENKRVLNKYHCVGMDLKHFIFPAEYNMESLIGLGNDTSLAIKDFKLDFYDTRGELLFSDTQKLDYDQDRYFNLTELLRQHKLDELAGTVSLRPVSSEAESPVDMNGIAAFKHRKNGYLTTTAASGSMPDNIPFYNDFSPPSYLLGKSTVGVTNFFARGVCSDAFDTFFAIAFQSGNLNLQKKIRYEIEVINESGIRKFLYRELTAHGADFLKLSEIVKELNHSSKEGFYTVWFYAVGAHLYGNHILLRKSDSAIAVEHTYVGKYGL